MPQAFLVWPLALLGLLLCSVHAARTLVDLGNCSLVRQGSCLHNV